MSRINLIFTVYVFDRLLPICPVLMGLLGEKPWELRIKEIKEELTTVKRFIIIEGDGSEGWPDYEDILNDAPDTYPDEPSIKETDIAELFYTSGTTGNPKGVVLSHRGLCLHALGFLAHYHYDDSDIQLHTIPLFHVNGWGTPQFLTWVGGVHLMQRQFIPQKVLQNIEKERATRIFLVPTMVNMLLQEPDLHIYDLSSLKLMIIGGAPTIPEKIKEIEEKFGCRAVSAYGMTETSPVMCNSLPKAHKHKTKESRQLHQAKTGLEMIGVQIRVVDENMCDIKADGSEVGEIISRANSVFEGYWKLPQETDAAITDGWFHTGDLAVIDEDHYITIVDRKKDIIISGGENIASIEVEAIINAHPAVIECALIGIPDETWGEIPKAYIVLQPGATITEEEIIFLCKKKLAGYKAPKQVEFIESLPKSGTGKILKQSLRGKYWEGRAKKV